MLFFNFRLGVTLLAVLWIFFPSIVNTEGIWQPTVKVDAELEPDDEDSDGTFSTGGGWEGEMDPEDGDRDSDFGDSEFSGDEVEPGDDDSNGDFSLPENLPIEEVGPSTY